MVCTSMKSPKFQADSPSMTTHAVQLLGLFNALHLLIIPLQCSSVTNYVDVFSLSIAEYKNEEIPNTAEEPPWNQSTK